MPWRISTMPIVSRRCLPRKLPRTVLRQVETRHHVRHHHHVVAVDVARTRARRRRIGDRQHRVGMRMVHVLCGSGACRMVSTDGAGAPVTSVFVASSLTICGSDSAVQRTESPHVIQPDRGEAACLDGLEVPAAALDVKDVRVSPKRFGSRDLDRGVAAAVQHQRTVAARAGATCTPAIRGRRKTRPLRRLARGFALFLLYRSKEA